LGHIEADGLRVDVCYLSRPEDSILSFFVEFGSDVKASLLHAFQPILNGCIIQCGISDFSL
jgi:hypothetical protein